MFISIVIVLYLVFYIFKFLSFNLILRWSRFVAVRRIFLFGASLGFFPLRGALCFLSKFNKQQVTRNKKQATNNTQQACRNKQHASWSRIFVVVYWLRGSRIGNLCSLFRLAAFSGSLQGARRRLRGEPDRDPLVVFSGSLLWYGTKEISLGFECYAINLLGFQWYTINFIRIPVVHQKFHLGSSGSPEISLGLHWYTVNFMRILVVHHKWHYKAIGMLSPDCKNQSLRDRVDYKVQNFENQTFFCRLETTNCSVLDFRRGWRTADYRTGFEGSKAPFRAGRATEKIAGAIR